MNMSCPDGGNDSRFQANYYFLEPTARGDALFQGRADSGREENTKIRKYHRSIGGFGLIWDLPVRKVTEGDHEIGVIEEPNERPIEGQESAIKIREIASKTFIATPELHVSGT
jgi:hypothetical protein